MNKILSSSSSASSCGARCIGHSVRTWSAVCSEAPHSQFSEEAKLHLGMDEWNRPTQIYGKDQKKSSLSILAQSLFPSST